MSNPKKIPTTIEEVGVHLFYLGESITKLEKAVNEIPNGFADVRSVAAIENRVTKLEDRQNMKNTLLWVGLVASSIINIVVIYQLFTGK